jgi:hypothetical protein
VYAAAFAAIVAAAEHSGLLVVVYDAQWLDEPPSSTIVAAGRSLWTPTLMINSAGRIIDVSSSGGMGSPAYHGLSAAAGIFWCSWTSASSPTGSSPATTSSAGNARRLTTRFSLL